jgi:hypothetical protein
LRCSLRTWLHIKQQNAGVLLDHLVDISARQAQPKGCHAAAYALLELLLLPLQEQAAEVAGAGSCLLEALAGGCGAQ